MKEPKQTIIVRKDLKMRKGKLAAQVAHASMKVFMDTFEDTELAWDDLPRAGIVFPVSDAMIAWFKGIYTKIVLGCDSEEEIFALERKARAANIPYAVVTDVGKTEFDNVPTVTCIALGPYDAEKLEEMTKGFSLL